jgi:hypothetical protein
MLYPSESISQFSALAVPLICLRWPDSLAASRGDQVSHPLVFTRYRYIVREFATRHPVRAVGKLAGQ